MDSQRKTDLVAWLKEHKIPLRVALQFLQDEDKALKDRVKRREKMVSKQYETRTQRDPD